jgi:outer membrane receptor protein involved in Fe transport
VRQWSIEGILSSDFDGPFNFLIGGIYFDHRNRGGDYFVNAFGLDYAGGVLGGLTSLGLATDAATAAAAAAIAGGGTPADALAASNAAFAASPALYLGPTFFNSETSGFELESYGIFGEVYVDITDNLSLTVGARYSNDSKSVSARSPLLATLVPFGTTDVASVISAQVDADPVLAGSQPYRTETASFDEITGRIVLDWQWSPDNLIYLSYSRGYKSGGINPPVNPVEFPSVQSTFAPEIINAYEIGSKNTLAGGAVQLNGAAFIYDYGDLQLSRILARTSINTNTSATVWGVELEAIVSPDPAWLFNLTASYLNTSIGNLQLIDSRDPSGGRSDVVIIKNLDNASNCAVIPDAAGNSAGANGFVTAVNGLIGLPGPVVVPGTNTTGAFSSCAALANAAAGGALAPLFGNFNIAEGAAVDVTGNELPQAPNWKFSIGGQYTHDFDNGMNAVFRVDYAFTGDQWSRSFNSPIDNIPSYGITNAQVQLNGNDDRWFVRAFVQNVFDNDAITGQYVTDPSSGLFTNIFTLEPRRYGLAAGIRF